MKTLLLLVATIILGSECYADPAADPNASAATKTVLTYLTNLPNRNDHRIVSGQWSGWNGFNAAAMARVETIFNNTKQRPGGDTTWLAGEVNGTARIFWLSKAGIVQLLHLVF